MTTTLTPDLAVIGAGSGGLSVAAGAVQMGASVVLVEKGRMGGDCLNYGCVPSKSLIAAAHAGCYSMSLANVLAARRTPHEGLDVSAQCVADTGPDGFAVTAVELDVRARVPGLDAATFAELAREAERLCPVSRLMRGNVEVRLRAALV